MSLSTCCVPNWYFRGELPWYAFGRGRNSAGASETEILPGALEYFEWPVGNGSVFARALAVVASFSGLRRGPFVVGINAVDGCTGGVSILSTETSKLAKMLVMWWVFIRSRLRCSGVMGVSDARRATATTGEAKPTGRARIHFRKRPHPSQPISVSLRKETGPPLSCIHQVECQA
jgi:hypothetical protein